MSRSIAVVTGILAVAAAAVAEPPAVRGARDGGQVSVPLVSATGRPVFCTHNRTPSQVRPDALGGYRLTGLAAGRYQVHLALEHEQVDVLVTVPHGGEVVVPPVVARGRCQHIEVTTRGEPSTPTSSSWALRYGRSYRAAFGVTASPLSPPRAYRR